MTAIPIPRLHLFLYGSLALPLAFAGVPLYIHAPDFYAVHHGMSLTHIGIVLLLVRIFDAVQDPVIGLLSDRFHQHRGAILFVFLVMLGTGFFLLFSPPQGASLYWFAFTVMLATTSFSVLTINLNALGGLWTDNTAEQTRITSTREALGLIGLLLASIAPSLLQRYEAASSAFYHVSLMLFGLLTLAGILFYRWGRLYRSQLTASRPAKLAPPLWSILKEQRLFYSIYMINALATSIPAAMVLFYIRDRIGAESYSGLFLLLYFIAGVAGMPLWQRVAQRIGKPQCWLMAMLLAVLSFFWAAFLSTGDLVQYGIVCLASGLALGAELALPPSMLADSMHRNQSQSSATTQFSVLAFLSKAALAFAAGLCLPLLEATGYRTGADNSADALKWLAFFYAILPCTLKILAACLLYYFISQQRKGLTYEENRAGRMPDRSSHDVI